MKKHFLYLIILILLAGFGVTSCSRQQDKFIVKGEFTNLPEAELYFWTPAGGREKIDTVYVHAGKFTYESPQRESGWYTMLFQNMSEQVLFAEPGQTVKLSADATHLRNMTIKGGKANALMTEFRQLIAQDTNPQVQAEKAQTFIQQHPESIVSVYLFMKYFVQSPDADTPALTALLDILLPHHADNEQLQQLQARMAATQRAIVGQQALPFQVRDIDGRDLTLDAFKDSTLLLCFWANWAQDSKDDLRKLKDHILEWPKDVSVLTLSLDLQRFSWRTFLRIDSIPGKHVCDMNGWESPILTTYGVNELPTYVLIDKQHQIIARENSVEQIAQKLKP